MKNKIISVCIAAALFSSGVPSAYAESAVSAVKINEICSRNKTAFSDGSGKFSDYIELHNTSKKSVSVGGMGLSDDRKDPFAFKFPKNTVIPADGYIIVFCDGTNQSKNGEYHAPFKLSGSGETLYLTSSDKKISDTVSFPSLGEDMVYGRVNDGNEFDIMQPTPMKSNSASETVSYAGKPAFSKESGFYKDEFDLELSCDSQCVIYYTLDGSDPANSPSAVKYKNKIHIYNNNSDRNKVSAEKNITLMNYTPPYYNVDKGITVKAVCKNKNGTWGSTVTNSYFINKTAKYYNDMTVISVVTDRKNLFDPKTGIYAVGTMYDEWKKSSDYEKLDPVNSGNVTNFNQSGREWERPASVQIFKNGKQIVNDDMGIRMVGNYSRSYAQKSFTFYARSEYGGSKIKGELFKGLKNSKGAEIKSFDKITVRNGGNECVCDTTTRFRDTLASELSSGLEISAAASEDCILFVNGEFWGYYSMNEKLDEGYFGSHYGINKKDISIIKNWEQSGSKKSTDGYISFYYWAVDADMKKAENYKKFCETIDIQGFMDYITVETFICNSDWSNLDYVNNFMFWRSDKIDKNNPYADGKWRFALFDTESSAGLYYSENTRYDYDALGKMNREKTWGNISALFYNLMENSEFRKAFSDNYKRIVRENFDYNKADKLITKHSADIKAASEATDKRFGNKNNFDAAVKNVRDFYRRRPEYALKYLDELLKQY